MIFKLENRLVGNQFKPLVVAEVGINHMGDVNLCEDMILSALDAGADCVKLQTVNVDESYHPSTESYKVFKGAELSIEEINFLATAKMNN